MTGMARTSCLREQDSVFGHFFRRSLGDDQWVHGVTTAKKSQWLLQRLKLVHTLDSHRGCVNSVVWNDTGTCILSASDDHRLVVTRPYSKEVVADINTPHRANIFSAKFVPESNDGKIVSCAGDGMILFTDVERVEDTQSCLFSCHAGTAYEIQTMAADPHTFLSCGEDGTVRWFDLRIKNKCNKANCKEDIMIQASSPITSLSLNPVLPYYLAVGSSDSMVRIFDRRMLGTSSTGQTSMKSLDGLVSRFTVPELEGKNRRITSVQYRPDGQEVLASYSSDYVYVFNPLVTDTTKKKRLFLGHHSRTSSSAKKTEKSPQPMKKLRLRGDWSDTGPNARPERDNSASESTPQSSGNDGNEENPTEQGGMSVHANLMQRMTDALSRMLNDPSTRMAMQTLQRSRERAASSRQENVENRHEETVATSDDSNNQREFQQQSESGTDSEYTAQSQQVNPAGGQANSEPEVNLRYRDQGLESSTISISRPAGDLATDGYASSDDDSRPLPGPSQVVTHPGVSSTDPVTGQRQRKRGVSGPPTGASIDFPAISSTAEINDMYEYEVERDDDEQSLAGDRDLDLAVRDREILQPAVDGKFTGHRNARTMIKEACWWGTDYILSGSDCGHVFGWHRKTGKLLLLLEADRHVVNCVRPHPLHPVLATSGIDYNVKLWAPLKEEPDFNQEAADILVCRNEVMLEETRDTITVPATLMIRMLASLNQIRRAGRLIPRVLERRRQREQNENEVGVEDEDVNANDENEEDDSGMPGGSPQEPSGESDSPEGTNELGQEDSSSSE